MPDDRREQEVPVLFPFQGIDNSNGFTQQRPGTCQDGTNVRAYDSVTDRRRGGSRAGLTPFFGPGTRIQVNGFNVIQSLSCVVTASGMATAQTPVITSFGVAYLSGQQPITIEGKNFTGATSVYFGTVPAVWFQVISDTQIYAQMFPVTVPQTVNLAVTTPNGVGTAPFGFLFAPIDGTFTLGQPAAATNMDGGSNALGSDGKIWAGVNHGPIINCDTALTFTTFTLASNSNTTGGVCAGPDGNIWSVDKANKSVWVTPPGGGPSVSFTLTSGTRTWWSIVADPHGTGNVWVIASDTATRLNLYLYKVTQTGTVTEYGPYIGQAMLGACIGPDLNLWGIKDGSNVYTADLALDPPVVVGFVMSAITHNVYNVVVGNDLRIWASDNSGNYYAFDVSNPAGGTPYDTALSVSPIQQACAGPDGKVWAIDGGTTSAVVLFSTAMDGTQVALSPLNLATGDVYGYLLLTAGADGALYSPGAGSTAGSFAKFTGSAATVFVVGNDGVTQIVGNDLTSLLVSG